MVRLQQRSNIFPDTLFTVKEAASYLKLNPLTVYGYIRQGKLNAVRFGRYYRIVFKDLLHFIDMHKIQL